AALAAEVAAGWPDAVSKLILIAPYGLYEESDPTADVFAQTPDNLASMVSAKPDEYSAYIEVPAGEDDVEWDLTLFRAQMAAARVLWPLGDTRLAKRLGRIHQETLIIWGADDKIIPPSYAEKFAAAISGPTTIAVIEGAGHKVEFDAPDAVADAVKAFL
ncbi:MAG: alpha/beta hydrolase, partial [Rhodospirillales bacterium]|nr:alpha/beta hydrolase [Rhodospirillales bacterium]